MLATHLSELQMELIVVGVQSLVTIAVIKKDIKSLKSQLNGMGKKMNVFIDKFNDQRIEVAVLKEKTKSITKEL